MLVKNNYKECLTNLACSIRKYFELDYKHNTLDYIDKLLEEKQPKNVVVILFDGMGSRILDRTLSKSDFLIKHKYKEITTVFPATTTAATTSMQTGLNPIEHGYLGWNMYLSPIDETVELYTGINKETGTPSAKYHEVKKEYLSPKTIVDEINEQNKYHAISLFPFKDTKYKDLDEMISIIEKKCQKEGKKYIYAYDDEPDHTMHDLGPDSKAKELIKTRNNKIEELSKKLDDTIIFIVADHGHIKTENLYLKDYPELLNMLERTTSIEPRATSFKVKKELQKEFEKKFKETFKNNFDLYSKEEVISSKLFGDGIENPLFKNALGDYLSIAKTNKAILTDGDAELYSLHAGYTEDEIHIPLIIIDKTAKENANNYY